MAIASRLTDREVQTLADRAEGEDRYADVHTGRPDDPIVEDDRSGRP